MLKILEMSEKVISMNTLNLIENFLNESKDKKPLNNILAEKNLQNWVIFQNGLITTKFEDYLEEI